MKTLFKSFITALLIGMPFTVILIIFLYINKTDALQSAPQASQSENTFEETSGQNEALAQTGVSSVTLAFAGDVQFSEDYTKAYDTSGISIFADEKMLSYMQNADLFMLNHEFVFSLRGEPMEEKQYTFRTDPKYVEILQELGTDVVSIANNHTLDYGQEAFLDTLDTLEQADIDYAGGGKNISEALSPAVYTINGQSFAIFAGTRVLPSSDWYAKPERPGMLPTYDPAELNQAISDAESQYDHTIVFVHWGIERNEFPEEYQRILAKGYIDAGADLVVGCHPHVLQGFEYYNGVPIVYSLGNYLFGNRADKTVLLNAEFDANGKLTLRLIPCHRINGVLTEIESPKNLFLHLSNLSFGVNVSEKGVLVQK